MAILIPLVVTGKERYQGGLGSYSCGAEEARSRARIRNCRRKKSEHGDCLFSVASGAGGPIATYGGIDGNYLCRPEGEYGGKMKKEWPGDEIGGPLLIGKLQEKGRARKLRALKSKDVY